MAADASFPQGGDRSQWLARYEAYAVASGADRDRAAKARVAVEGRLHTLAPEADAAVLEASGLRDVELFFAALTWRGWIGRA